MVDKLMEIYTLRIPSITKNMIDGLSPAWKKKLNEEIRITIARVIHESKFDPKLYLNEGDISLQMEEE